MSRVMKKTDYCIGENNYAHQLCIYDCTGRFMSDLVGNPKDQGPVVQN